MRRSRPAPSTSNILLAALVLAAAAFPVAGCGSAASKAADTPAAAEDPEADISVLDKGEWSITELFGPPGGPAPTATASPAATAVPVTEPGAVQAAQGGAKGAPVSSGDVRGNDPCGIACNALASMERAARHLCEMAGPDEPRCTSARERVKNASERVAAHCACNNQ